jgi:hypothetical protein
MAHRKDDQDRLLPLFTTTWSVREGSSCSNLKGPSNAGNLNVGVGRDFMTLEEMTASFSIQGYSKGSGQRVQWSSSSNFLLRGLVAEQQLIIKIILIDSLLCVGRRVDGDAL